MVDQYFLPREKIAREDFLRMFFASILGMCINMNAFFKGLELSTPINSGIIITLSPILILILSSIFLSEKIKYSQNSWDYTWFQWCYFTDSI